MPSTVAKRSSPLSIHFGFPDSRKQPMEWDKSWGRQIELIYKGSRDVVNDVLIAWQVEQQSQSLLFTHRGKLGDLCRLQLKFSRIASEHLVAKNFESRWLSMTAADRRTHLLDGIVRACSTDGLEHQRLFANEVTVANMEKEGGRVFLRLMKEAILDDCTSIPTTPKFIPNARFEKLVMTSCKGSSDSARLLQETFKLARNYVIYNFLQQVLNSIDGVAFVPITLRKASEHSKKLSPGIRQVLSASLGESAKELIRRRNEERKTRVMSCENCGQSDLDGIHLSACASCRDKLGRRVFYCSKDCQKQDWKQRHKLICGKPLTLDIAQQTAVGAEPIAAPSQNPWEDPLYAACITELWSQRPVASLCPDGTGLFPTTVGPATSGYKRSVELRYQVTLMNEGVRGDARDYLLSTTDGQFVAISMPFLILKSQFRKYRDAAMYAGDRKAVAIIAQYLSTKTVENARGSGFTFTSEGVLEQLSKEYEFDVAKAVADLESQRMRRPNQLGELEIDVAAYTLEGQKMLRDPALTEKRESLRKKAREDMEAAMKNSS